MKIEMVVPEGVMIPHRLRAVNMDKVRQLAESMKALGLQQPITVWSKGDDHLELVAGRHRLAAAIMLEWNFIDAIYVNKMSAIDRQLWEIDENLMRAELTPVEEAEHLAKRAELWEAREMGGSTCPTHDASGRKKTPQQEKGFAADTAAATGLSKRAINRAVARAKSIPEDVRDTIKGTKLDTGSYMDGIKGMDPEEQREKVKQDLKDPVPSPPKHDHIGAEMTAKFIIWWNKASADKRQEMIDWAAEQGVRSTY